MDKFVICYWDIRGYAEPARMMLEYGGVEYENKLVKDAEKWFGEKFSLGMDFPNLPYIVDKDIMLTESWAIYRHLGRKLNLFPTSVQDERQADMLQGVINDIRTGFTRYMYSGDAYSKIDELRKNQDTKVNMMEKYLKGKKFLLGENLSFLDFALFETFDHHRLFFSDIFEKYPNVQKYMETFQSLKPISDYLCSKRYKQFPINGGMAVWGGQDVNDRK